MDVLSGLQLWFFMAFLQFAPLDNLQQDQTFRYSLTGKLFSFLKIEVTHLEETPSGKKLTIKTTGVGLLSNKASCTAVLTKNKDWILQKLEEDGYEILSKPMLLHRKKGELLINTDESYILKLQSETPLKYSFYLRPGKSAEEVSYKRAVYQAEGFKLTIYRHETLGVLKIHYAQENLGFQIAGITNLDPLLKNEKTSESKIKRAMIKKMLLVSDFAQAQKKNHKLMEDLIDIYEKELTLDELKVLEKWHRIAPALKAKALKKIEEATKETELIKK